MVVGRSLIAGTDGDLLLFDNLEFNSPFSRPMTQVQLFNCATRRWVRCRLRRWCCLLEMSDDSREQYKITKRFVIVENLCRITSLAVSPSEDCLACTLENHQMFVWNLVTRTS